MSLLHITHIIESQCSNTTTYECIPSIILHAAWYLISLLPGSRGDIWILWDCQYCFDGGFADETVGVCMIDSFYGMRDNILRDVFVVLQKHSPFLLAVTSTHTLGYLMKYCISFTLAVTFEIGGIRSLFLGFNRIVFSRINSCGPRRPPAYQADNNSSCDPKPACRIAYKVATWVFSLILALRPVWVCADSSDDVCFYMFMILFTSVWWPLQTPPTFNLKGGLITQNNWNSCVGVYDL